MPSEFVKDLIQVYGTGHEILELLGRVNQVFKKTILRLPTIRAWRAWPTACARRRTA